jgi:hypothetical protein
MNAAMFLGLIAMSMLVTWNASKIGDDVEVGPGTGDAVAAGPGVGDGIGVGVDMIVGVGVDMMIGVGVG